MDAIITSPETYEPDLPNDAHEPNDDDNHENGLDDCLKDFVTKLLANPHVTKKLVLEIFHDVEDMVTDVMTICQTESSKCEQVKTAFSKLKSIYRMEKQLSRSSYFMKPKVITILETTGTVLQHGIAIEDNIKEKIVLMPIEHQIRSFFEMPNVLKNVVQFMREKEQETGAINNFLQGQLWKTIRSNYEDSEIIIPVILYGDDFEPDNGLSGNAGTNKQMGIYYTFPVLPQYLLSSPFYVFDALLFPSRIKTMEGGLKLSLVDLVNVFVQLEVEGIVINDGESEHQVRFVISLIVGDNLAIHELLGFIKSFNSTLYCRFCCTPKTETKYDTVIRTENLRNMMNYEEHLSRNNPKETGVEYEPIFHTLKHFHVTKNFYADIFHDMFEGVIKYELSSILKYYIYEKKAFSLNIFNNLMTQFNYGVIEMTNTPKELTEQHIKNGKIKWTGGQTKTFVHFVTLILGHLVNVDDDNYEYWEFLLELVELTDMLLCSNVTELYLRKLEATIKHHLQTYLMFFGTLKPKHHFLLHYSQIIQQVGPLRNLMCYVFEQKNRQIKQYANVMNQRINLSLSLATKSAYRFEKFMKNLSLSGLPSVLTGEKSTLIAQNDLAEMGYKDLFRDLLVNTDTDCIKNIHFIKFKNKVFKPAYFIYEKETNDVNILCKIQHIISINDKYFLVVVPYDFQYSNHFKSFIVGDKSSIVKLFDLHKIETLPFNLHKNYSGETFFRVKYV